MALLTYDPFDTLFQFQQALDAISLQDRDEIFDGQGRMAHSEDGAGWPLIRRRGLMHGQRH